MTELPPEAAALLADAQRRHGPSQADRERVLTSLHESLGIGAAAAIAAGSAATASATAAAAEGASLAPVAAGGAKGALFGWKSAVLTWKASKVMLATVAIGGAVGVGTATLKPALDATPAARSAQVDRELPRTRARRQHAASAEAQPSVAPEPPTLAAPEQPLAAVRRERAQLAAPSQDSHAQHLAPPRAWDRATAAAQATAAAPIAEPPNVGENIARAEARTAVEAPALHRGTPAAGEPTNRAVASSERSLPAIRDDERSRSRRVGASGSSRSRAKLAATLGSAPSLATTPTRNSNPSRERDEAAASASSEQVARRDGKDAAKDELVETRASAGPAERAGELSLLRRALASLRDDDAQRALSVLREHAVRYPGGAFTTERRGLRVIALCASGQLEAGRHEQSLFLRQSASSPIAARVRAACSEADQ